MQAARWRERAGLKPAPTSGSGFMGNNCESGAMDLTKPDITLHLADQLSDQGRRRHDREGGDPGCGDPEWGDPDFSLPLLVLAPLFWPALHPTPTFPHKNPHQIESGPRITFGVRRGVGGDFSIPPRPQAKGRRAGDQALLATIARKHKPHCPTQTYTSAFSGPRAPRSNRNK